MQQWLKSQPEFQEAEASSSRLPALYADLAAHRAGNRASFDASVAWWAKTLSRACLDGVQPSHTTSVASSVSATSIKGKEAQRGKQGDRLSLHVDQALLDELTVDDVGRPLGLGTVVTELSASRHLTRRTEFVGSKTPLAGPVSTSRSLPAALAALSLAPLSWAAAHISSGLGLASHEDDPGERDWKLARGDWVIWDNLQALGDATLRLHHASPRLSPLECLFSKQELRTVLVEPALRSIATNAQSPGEIVLSDRDYDVLLQYLTRDRGVVQVDGNVVKLVHEDGQSLRNADKISDAEKGVVNVKSTHSQLEKQVNEIEARIAERQAKVAQCLREKRKEQAMSYLRSKKTLEELLQRRVGSLETLHGVLVKIEQAASDVEIMKAYEVSTSTLKTLLGDARLQPERIDATMDSMQETLADADEIRTAIESGQEGMRQQSGADLDDNDIEAELAALQRDVEEERIKEQGAESAADARGKSAAEQPAAMPSRAPAGGVQPEGRSEKEPVPAE